MRKRLLPALLAGLINQFFVAACLGAQASDVSGTWILSISVELPVTARLSELGPKTNRLSRLAA